MKVLGRWMPPLGLAACLMMMGCPKKEEPATPPTPAPAEPSAPAPEAPTNEASVDAGSEPPGEVDAGAPATPGPDAQGTLPENPKNREWTAGIVDLPRPLLPPVTLRDVRTARNEGFDRTVFEFEGTQVPGYHVEYVDSPVRHCASGETVQLAGQGWLQVRLQPAQAHAEGKVTVAQRERKPALAVLQELELTCDFEADVTWVLGVKAPNKYRVMELREPTRLVVDVQH